VNRDSHCTIGFGYVGLVLVGSIRRNIGASLTSIYSNVVFIVSSSPIALPPFAAVGHLRDACIHRLTTPDHANGQTI